MCVKRYILGDARNATAVPKAPFWLGGSCRRQDDTRKREERRKEEWRITQCEKKKEITHHQYDSCSLCFLTFLLCPSRSRLSQSQSACPDQARCDKLPYNCRSHVLPVPRPRPCPCALPIASVQSMRPAPMPWLAAPNTVYNPCPSCFTPSESLYDWTSWTP